MSFVVSASTAAPDLPSVTRPGAPPAGGHLAAVDVIRFLTIGGVIAVHSTSLANAKSSVAANAVLQVLHVTRSVFLMLSAFVLTLSASRRPLAHRAFWRRRYPLVVFPYVVWSAIYFVTGGSTQPWGFVVDLFDGGAHFHLYFLLLTMQLYLVFPALMAGLRRWPRSVIPAVWASLAFQLLFTAAAHYDFRPPLIGIWFSHPGSWLPSYTFYIIGGIAAACYFEQVTGWVRAHTRLVAVACAGTVAVSLAAYLAEVYLAGRAPIVAAAVFQPADVLEAVTVTAVELAVGLWVAERASARRLAWLERSSDVSFGVFLAHPLLVAGALDLASAAGLTLAGWPSGLIEALIVVGLAPFAYAVTFVAVDWIRRTRLSLAFTGRRGPRPVPTPAPAPS
jgi:peptidoglycan/LPS O-acetylase OafA/YrhL